MRQPFLTDFSYNLSKIMPLIFINPACIFAYKRNYAVLFNMIIVDLYILLFWNHNNALRVIIIFAVLLNSLAPTVKLISRSQTNKHILISFDI
jgi:hypothetical protein